MRFKAILVPLDGSEFTERTLVPTLAFAASTLAKVFFIRVAIPLSVNLDPKHFQRFIKLRQDEVKRYLRAIQSRFSSSTGDIEIQVLVGRAAQSILKYAQEKEI